MLNELDDSAVGYGPGETQGSRSVIDDLEAEAGQDRLQILACAPRRPDDRDEVIPVWWSG